MVFVSKSMQGGRYAACDSSILVDSLKISVLPYISAEKMTQGVVALEIIFKVSVDQEHIIIKVAAQISVYYFRV